MILLSVLGSALPFILVAPIVRVTYLAYSRKTFWIAFTLAILSLISTGLVSIGISLMSVTLLIGLYSEIFKKYKNMFVAGFIGILVSSVATVTATQQWLVLNGTNLSTRLHEQIQLVLKQAQQLNSNANNVIKWDSDFLVGQAPSVLVALLIMSLALALILEQPFGRIFRLPLEKIEGLNLLGFKLPDSFIWIAMISFLFSFLDIGQKDLSLIATNIVNIMVVLYFFQGLAVVEAFFTALKLGFFIRFITYVVFLIQLFFLVAGIGLIDYWLEFRKRFIRIRLNS